MINLIYHCLLNMPGTRRRYMNDTLNRDRTAHRREYVVLRKDPTIYQLLWNWIKEPGIPFLSKRMF